MRPPIRYAKSGALNIAYQVTGDGPRDLVLIPGFVSHLAPRPSSPNFPFPKRRGQAFMTVRRCEPTDGIGQTFTRVVAHVYEAEKSSLGRGH